MNVAISTTTFDHMIRQVVEDEIEMLFYSNHHRPPLDDIIVETLGKMPLAFMVRPTHPLTELARISRNDLSAFQLAHGSGIPLAESFGFSVELQCDNYHILRDLTCDSDTVWLSSPIMAKADLEAQRLVVIHVYDSPALWSDVTLFRRRGRALSPVGKQIIEFVANCYSSSEVGNCPG